MTNNKKFKPPKIDPNKLTPLEALMWFLEKYKTYDNAAKAFGVKRQSFTEWLDRGHIPAYRVPQAVKLTNGKITHHEFRPDVYPEGF